LPKVLLFLAIATLCFGQTGPLPNAATDVPRVHLSEAAGRGLLVRVVHPDYPPPAKEKKVQGDVLFRILVTVQGDVTVLDILSGDPLLRDAARQAVLQWKYYPYYRRNGQACEAVTLARVRFILPKPMPTAAKQ
jgi:TonB family protein